MHAWVQTVGEMHLGGLVNRFRHGSLVMQVRWCHFLVFQVMCLVDGTLWGQISHHVRYL